MARAYSSEQLASGTFYLTMAFLGAIVLAIQLILW